MEKMEVLRQYFGFSSFREGQQTLIDAVLAGRDVLGVMPTGGGKSLCYELPALLLPGLTLVISPLISLMKDQVMALQNAGIPAGCIHSAMSVEELREAYRDTRFGAYKILYIAPERLLTDGFCALAQELGYAPDVKLYRQNPDGYRGHVGDISGMLRIAVTGRESSPDLFEVMRILGRGAVLGRLRRALDALAQR